MDSSDPVHLVIELDSRRSAKLYGLAERTGTQVEILAGSLLASALDAADPDVQGLTDMLDRIPGAFERAQLGRAQARSGGTVPLEKL